MYESTHPFRQKSALTGTFAQTKNSFNHLSSWHGEMLYIHI
jgi:hypothetical protein